jgi:hypothetical protein
MTSSWVTTRRTTPADWLPCADVMPNSAGSSEKKEKIVSKALPVTAASQPSVEQSMNSDG